MNRMENITTDDPSGIFFSFIPYIDHISAYFSIGEIQAEVKGAQEIFALCYVKELTFISIINNYSHSPCFPKKYYRKIQRF